MYVERDIASRLKELAAGFPAVFLTGPRQSGKSTLLRHQFGDYQYVSLEETDIREFAENDPRGFLQHNQPPLVIDEVQRAPELLTYLQGQIDQRNTPGQYLLSGSQNFLTMRSVSQSLAGRVGLATLLPFALHELGIAGLLPDEADDWLFQGGYPRHITTYLTAFDFFQSYLPTYVERDIRLETAVHDLGRFQTFLTACAIRAGSLLNIAGLARDVGVNSKTAGSWLSVLEESYLVFRLMPYQRNTAKRFTKAPKLYFYDTGLLCSLLGITNEDELAAHDLRGSVFENAVVSEFIKKSLNAGRHPKAFYYRNADSRSIEIDLVVEQANHLELFEIKAAQTARVKFTRALRSFASASPKPVVSQSVIYDGPEPMAIEGVGFVNWRTLAADPYNWH